MNTGLLTNEQSSAQIYTEGKYEMVASFGDVAEEYAAIRGSVALFDFSSHGKFKISGENHLDWISGLVSRNLEFMDSESVIMALCFNEAAEVLGIVSLYKYDDSVLIETETAERDLLAAWFEQHRTDGVEINDLSDSSALLGLEGPAAFKVAQTLLDYEISSIPFQGFVEVEYQGEPAILARTGYTGEYGYKILADARIANNLWDDFSAQVRELGGRQCGQEALTTTMLEVRQPIGSLETLDLSAIPAGLGWMVDFNKADEYIGKDALMEQCASLLEQRTIGFITDGQASIKIGNKVILDDQVIGRVIAVCYSPTLQAQLGLALNAEPFTVPDLTWSVQDEQGQSFQARSLSSPYVMPRSWKVKML